MQTRLITVLREVPGQTALAVSPNASVAVYLPGGTFSTLAPGVVDGDGTPVNPLTADSNGQVRIGVPDGIYDLRITHTDGVTKDLFNQSWADQLAAADEAKAARDMVVPLAAQVQEHAEQVADDRQATDDNVALSAASAGTAVAARDAALAAIQGVTNRLPVRLAATANVVGTYNSGANTFTYTATGLQNIDGTAPALGDRVVLPYQTAGLQNWIYTVTTLGATGVNQVLTRATDSDTGAEILGGVVEVLAGISLGGSIFSVLNSSIVLGTDSILLSRRPGIMAVETALRQYNDNLLKMKVGSDLSEIVFGTITSDLAANAANVGSTRAGGPITPTPNAFTLLTSLSVVMSATAGAAELHAVSTDAVTGIVTTDYIIPFTSPGGAYNLPANLLQNLLLKPNTHLVIKGIGAGVALRRGASGSVPSGGTYIITAATSNTVGDHPTVENPAAVGDYNCAMSFSYLLAPEVIESRLDAIESLTNAASGPSPVPTDELYFRRSGSPTTFFRSTFAKVIDSMNYVAAGVTFDGQFMTVPTSTLLQNLDPEYGARLIKPQTSSWTDNITFQTADLMGVESSTVTAAYVEAADQASADYFVTARFSLLSETSGGRPGVLIGASGVAGDFICYEFAYTPTGSVLLFRRASAASTTQLGSVPAAFLPYAAIGETVSLGIGRSFDSSGNVVLACYVNGRLALTVTDSDPAKITRAGRGGLKMSSQSSKLISFSAGARTAFVGSLEIVTPESDRCYRRDEGLQTRSFTVSGTAVVGAGAVMARIINDRTKAEVVAPFTLDGAPGSIFTGMVPNLGVGWWRIQVWQAGAPRLRRSRRFAIARKVIAMLGQSNMENMFGAPSITGLEQRSPVRVLKGDGNMWYPLIVGPGIARIAKLVTTSWTDEPYGFLCYAITGSTVESWLVGGSSWNAFINASTGAGQPACQFEFDEAFWDQGQANSLADYATQLENTSSVFSQLRTVSGRPNLPIFIASTGRNTLGSNYDTVRRVEYALSQLPNNYYGPSRIDIPLDLSGVHHPPAGYQTVGSRWAQATLKRDAKVAFGARGPIPTGATAVAGSTKITVQTQLEPGAGSALVDAAGNLAGTGLTGFNVYYNGVLQPISATAITASTNIELTVPAVPSGVNVSVFIAEGGNPDVSNYPRDNSALGLPLRPLGTAIDVMVS